MFQCGAGVWLSRACTFYSQPLTFKLRYTKHLIVFIINKPAYHYLHNCLMARQAKVNYVRHRTRCFQIACCCCFFITSPNPEIVHCLIIADNHQINENLNWDIFLSNQPFFLLWLWCNFPAFPYLFRNVSINLSMLLEDEHQSPMCLILSSIGRQFPRVTASQFENPAFLLTESWQLNMQKCIYVFKCISTDSVTSSLMGKPISTLPWRTTDAGSAR